jgi:hypothetical protein
MGQSMTHRTEGDRETFHNQPGVSGRAAGILREMYTTHVLSNRWSDLSPPTKPVRTGKAGAGLLAVPCDYPVLRLALLPCWHDSFEEISVILTAVSSPHFLRKIIYVRGLDKLLPAAGDIIHKALRTPCKLVLDE